MMRNRSGLLLVCLFILLLSNLSFRQPTAGQAAPVNAPPPPTQDYGVTCFVESGGIIIARAPSFHNYYSLDGGLTWIEGVPQTNASYCGSDCSSRKQAWDLWADAGGTTRYRFDPGVNILLSLDSGDTWEEIFDLSTIDWKPLNPPEPGTDIIIQPGPLDAMIDPSSGSLLLAMAHAGVLVRLPSGEWQWRDAGRYIHGESSIESGPGWEQADGLSPDSPEADIILEANSNYTTSLSFSPGGDLLATSGYDGGVKLFEFPNGDLRFWQEWQSGRSSSVIYGAAFSPDGSTLITCDSNVDRTLRFWDMQSRELIRKHDGFQTSAMDVTRVNGDQFFAIAYGEDSSARKGFLGCSSLFRYFVKEQEYTARNQVIIFRLPDGRNISTLKSQLGEITSLKFIPESSLLASGGFAGGVELWDTQSKDRLFTFQPDQRADDRLPAYRKTYAAGFHPSENTVLALFGDGSLKAWNVSTGEQAWHLALPVPHGWYLSTAAFSPDGQQVAIGMPNGTLLLFDTREGSLLSTRWIPDCNTLMKVAFSPNGEWLSAGYATGTIKAWQVDGLLE